MTWSKDNKYRGSGTLTPEGALAGVQDFVSICARITECERATRPFKAPVTADEIVEYARQAKEHFEELQEVNRALCSQPFSESHEALAQLVNIVPGLHAFATAEVKIVRDRAQTALMEQAGLS